MALSLALRVKSLLTSLSSTAYTEAIAPITSGRQRRESPIGHIMIVSVKQSMGGDSGQRPLICNEPSTLNSSINQRNSLDAGCLAGQEDRRSFNVTPPCDDISVRMTVNFISTTSPNRSTAPQIKQRVQTAKRVHITSLKTVNKM